MLARRVIPCLRCGQRTRRQGNEVCRPDRRRRSRRTAERYAREGADEIVFLDITAAHEGAAPYSMWFAGLPGRAFVPLTVGGGVRTVTEMRDVLRAGADKVSFNTAAVAGSGSPHPLRPKVRQPGRRVRGGRTPAAAADGAPQTWEVVTHGGRRQTELEAVAWAIRAVELGAGELLVTSMDRDGTRSGFDTELLHRSRREYACR